MSFKRSSPNRMKHVPRAPETETATSAERCGGVNEPTSSSSKPLCVERPVVERMPGGPVPSYAAKACVLSARGVFSFVRAFARLSCGSAGANQDASLMFVVDTVEILFSVYTPARSTKRMPHEPGMAHKSMFAQSLRSACMTLERGLRKSPIRTCTLNFVISSQSQY